MLFIGSGLCSSARLLGFVRIFVVAITVERCQNADINQALLEFFGEGNPMRRAAVHKTGFTSISR